MSGQILHADALYSSHANVSDEAAETAVQARRPEDSNAPEPLVLTQGDWENVPDAFRLPEPAQPAALVQQLVLCPPGTAPFIPPATFPESTASSGGGGA